MSHQETQTILPFSAISAFMAASSSTQEVVQPEMEFSGAGKNVQEVLNVVGEDFPIDTFLDFSHDDELFDEEEKKEVGLSPENQTLSNSSDSGETVDVPAFVGSELSVPAEELADLEWLSFFVEDSNYSGASAWPENSPGTSFPAPNRGLPMNTRIPCKTRSKRNRTGRIWSYRDGLSDSCSSSSTSSSSSSPLVLANLFRPVSGGVSVFLGGKPPKSHIRSPKPPENFGAVRRCTHCLVQKTPQWRAGPLGPKTLCNACGVRFKSGRLLPEYRPAGSPTFLNDVHSNNHRKVLEMRRRKEQVIPAGNMMAVESC